MQKYRFWLGYCIANDYGNIFRIAKSHSRGETKVTSLSRLLSSRCKQKVFFGGGGGVCHPRKKPNLMEHGETEDSLIIMSLHRKFSLGYLCCMADFSEEELDQRWRETHGVKIKGLRPPLF